MAFSLEQTKQRSGERGDGKCHRYNFPGGNKVLHSAATFTSSLKEVKQEWKGKVKVTGEALNVRYLFYAFFLS